MTNQALVPADIEQRYEVHEWRNGLAILTAAHPEEWEDILRVLRGFKLLRSDILSPGGRKSRIADKLDGEFLKPGWTEKGFDTRIVVDNIEHIAPTHKVDCYKNRVALEVEWNNKDPFYDRDLNNFRLLFDLRAIDAGVIVTRCTELQSIFDDLGRGPSYGSSTTHIAKLRPRLDGGSGGDVPSSCSESERQPMSKTKRVERSEMSAAQSAAALDLVSFANGRRFATILADPPWQFTNKTGKVAPEHKRLSRYGTMKLDEIMALPVAQLAAPTSHLYLWCPNAMLPEGLAVLKAWGFTYKSNVVWHKIRKDGGSDGRGVGFYFRNVTELILFGVRGKNARTLAPGRRQVNLLATRKREHSRKPDEQYEIIEACSPGPFLELFARGNRNGWTTWGNQADGDYRPTWKTYAHHSRAGMMAAE